MARVARFPTRLTPKQRAALALPIQKGTRRFYEVPGQSVFCHVLSRMDPETFPQVLKGWLSAFQWATLCWLMQKTANDTAGCRADLA